MARNGKSNKQDTYEDTDKDQIRSLRALVRKLQKVIKQQRRDMQKNRDVVDDYQDLLEEVEHLVPPPSKGQESCPECDSGKIKELELGNFVLLICQNPECDYRRRKKSSD